MTTGKTVDSCTQCRFLAGVEEFDAALYGIGPSEALVMDPQQRLMLEVRFWDRPFFNFMAASGT